MESKKRKFDITPSPFEGVEPGPKRQKMGNIEFISLQDYKNGILTDQDLNQIYNVACRGYITKSFLSLDTLNSDMMILAIEDSEIIGVCSFNFLDSQKNIAVIYLLCSKSTGIQKIGQKLIQNLVKRLQELSTNVTYILVQSVKKAIPFYEKQGFINTKFKNNDFKKDLYDLLLSIQEELLKKYKLYDEEYDTKFTSKSFNFDYIVQKIKTSWKNPDYVRLNNAKTWVDEIINDNRAFMYYQV